MQEGQNKVLVEPVEDSYYQVRWLYWYKGQQKEHIFRKGMARTALHTIEILLAHGYSVEPETILSQLYKEAKQDV